MLMVLNVMLDQPVQGHRFAAAERNPFVFETVRWQACDYPSEVQVVRVPKRDNLEPRAFLPTLQVNPSILIVAKKFSAALETQLHEAPVVVLGGIN